MNQAREHGVTGLPEDLYVCAAASAARLAAPAFLRRARYVDNQASHKLPTTHREREGDPVLELRGLDSHAGW